MQERRRAVASARTLATVATVPEGCLAVADVLWHRLQRGIVVPMLEIGNSNSHILTTETTPDVCASFPPIGAKLYTKPYFVRECSKRM